MNLTQYISFHCLKEKETGKKLPYDAIKKKKAFDRTDVHILFLTVDKQTTCHLLDKKKII